MLVCLALSMQLAAAPRLVDMGPRAPVSAVRLLTQADAPEPLSQAADLQQRIDALNARIRTLRPEWPAGAIALAVVGFSVSALILPGLPLTVFGAVAGAAGLFGFGAVFLVIGVGILSLGVVGLAAGIAGIAIGRSVSQERTREREALIRERDELVRQQRAPQVPPAGVRRDTAPEAWLTVAEF